MPRHVRTKALCPVGCKAKTVKQALEGLMVDIIRFRDERDWKQFHTPKDLAAAIAIESAELQEKFLWKDKPQIADELADPARRQKVVEELADVMIFALLLADCLDVDVEKAIRAKLSTNALKYPVAKAKGTAKKYTELHQ